jgi:hypothetical protein
MPLRVLNFSPCQWGGKTLNLKQGRITHTVMAKTVFDIAKALASQRESKHVEFKEKFDHTDAQDVCEVIKDIVAMANSGGGHILFGVRNDGAASGWDCVTRKSSRV